MSKRIGRFAVWLGPLALAGIAVAIEPRLSGWVKGREAALPLIMVMLLSSLLHPRSRYVLVTTLCYAVAFLALRDIVRFDEVRLPPQLEYEWAENAVTMGLLLVAVLAGIAAVGETAQPGSVWARRCYFGAAGLYFTGVGFINFVWHSSWQSLVLIGTGLMAFIGCLVADQVVAGDIAEKEDGQASDAAVQELTQAAHQRRLQSKEWRDPDADNPEKRSL